MPNIFSNIHTRPLPIPPSTLDDSPTPSCEPCSPKTKAVVRDPDSPLPKELQTPNRNAANALLSPLTKNVLPLDDGHEYSDFMAKYSIGYVLGNGAFSKVRLIVEKRTKREYAVKIIDKENCRGKEAMIQSEVDILKRAKHTNIIRLFEMYESPDSIYLVMELVTGGELFDSIVERGTYTESDAAKLVYEILLGVEYLHSCGICHRDLKPENLLFRDKSPNSQIMISDFGLSKIYTDHSAMRTACGTPGYVAPEVLLRNGYTNKVDMWSIGVITYILLCGYPPFYDDTNGGLFRKILSGSYEYNSPHWDDISSDAKNFIDRLLTVDADSRISATEALSHVFLTNNCENARRRANSLKRSYSNLAPTTLANLREFSRNRISSRDIHAACKVSLPPLPSLPAKQQQEQLAALQQQQQQQLQEQQQLQIQLQKKQHEQEQKELLEKQLLARQHEAKEKRQLQNANISVPTPKKRRCNSVSDLNLSSSPIEIDMSSETPTPLKYSEAVKNSVPTEAESKTESVNTINTSVSPVSAEYMEGMHSPEDPVDSTPVNNSFTTTAQKYKPAVNDPKSEMHRLKMLSLNISMKRPTWSTLFKAYKSRRLHDFRKYFMNAYDIVCLQDIYNCSGRAEQLTDFAKEFRLVHNYMSKTRKVLPSTEDTGLMILSAYPFERTARITFKHQVTSCCTRGALYTRINLGSACSVKAGKKNGILHVFNTSLSRVPRGCANLKDGKSTIIKTKFKPESYSSQNSNAVNEEEPLFPPPPIDTSSMTPQEIASRARLLQLAELRAFILLNLRDRSSRETVLILGDFGINARRQVQTNVGNVVLSTNSNSSSFEYFQALQILQGTGTAQLCCVEPEAVKILESVSNTHNTLMLTDVLSAKYGEHPVTYGDVDAANQPIESPLTPREDRCSRQSTEFVLCAPGHKNSSIIAGKMDASESGKATQRSAQASPVNFTKPLQQVSIDLANTHVIPLEIDGRPYSHISDHYGIHIGIRAPSYSSYDATS